MNTKIMQKIINLNIYEKISYVIKIIISGGINVFKYKEFKNKNIWLMGVGDDVFSNNSKVFYNFLKSKENIDLFWVANKANFEKLSLYIDKDKLIERGSINNYLFARNSKVCIYGFSDKDIAPGIFRLIKRKSVLVNISHGFDGLKGMPTDYYKPLPVDILCAASDFEKKVKIDYCGANEEKVVVTGFPRYDDWNSNNKLDKIKNILIMPTWRDWYISEKIKWNETKMYKEYSKMLKMLDGLSIENELKIKCILHPRLDEFYGKTNLFNVKNIEIVTSMESIQELMIEADLLITDYSSIYWDFVYMKKTAILYWFDYMEYKSKRGLIANETLTQNIVYDSEQLIKNINNKITKGITVNVESDKYFNWFDKKNCQRIYEEIEKKII